MHWRIERSNPINRNRNTDFWKFPVFHALFEFRCILTRKPWILNISWTVWIKRVWKARDVREISLAFMEKRYSVGNFKVSWNVLWHICLKNVLTCFYHVSVHFHVRHAANGQSFLFLSLWSTRTYSNRVGVLKRKVFEWYWHNPREHRETRDKREIRLTYKRKTVYSKRKGLWSKGKVFTEWETSLKHMKSCLNQRKNLWSRAKRLWTRGKIFEAKYMCLQPKEKNVYSKGKIIDARKIVRDAWKSTLEARENFSKQGKCLYRMGNVYECIFLFSLIVRMIYFHPYTGRMI